MAAPPAVPRDGHSTKEPPMTKGRSTKLWITLLDPEIRNGEPRLVQVWRLYKDLPGSGPNWSEPCQLGTDPGKSLQSLVWWYRRGQTWGMRFKAWTIVLTLLAGTVVVSWEQAPRAAACSCVRAALSSASCGIEGIREGMVLTVLRHQGRRRLANQHLRRNGA